MPPTIPHIPTVLSPSSPHFSCHSKTYDFYTPTNKETFQFCHPVLPGSSRPTVVMFDGKEEKKYGENQYLPALCEIGALCYLCPGGTDIFLLRRLRIPTSILVLFYLLKNRFVSSFYFSGVQKKIEHPLVIHHKLNFIDMT